MMNFNGDLNMASTAAETTEVVVDAVEKDISQTTTTCTTIDAEGKKVVTTEVVKTITTEVVTEVVTESVESDTVHTTLRSNGSFHREVHPTAVIIAARVTELDGRRGMFLHDTHTDVIFHREVHPAAVLIAAEVAGLQSTPLAADGKRGKFLCDRTTNHINTDVVIIAETHHAAPADTVLVVNKMVVKEGWVRKQHHNILHGMAPRYAKLTVDGLELYSDPADAMPLVNMGLEGARVDTLWGNDLALKLKLKYAAGRRPDRSPHAWAHHAHYVLQFQDEGERDEWAGALKDCSQLDGRHMISVTN